MNKQELIKHIENLPYNEGLIVDTIKISRNGLLKLIEQLGEPKKVTIPQFVAEIIEYYKGQNATLYDGLREKNFNKQYNEWLMNEQDAYDKVARAWLDGYDVEKEKRYIITLKSSEQKLYYHTEHEDYIFSSYDGVFYSEYHTKTDLEENGMSWVFDCPGIKIEEVEE